MWKKNFLTFPACFWIPIIFFNMNYNCPNLLDMRNLQEQVKKAFCYQKLFWPVTVWINCFSDRKNFANSQLSALKFKSFSRSLKYFFLIQVRTIFETKCHVFSQSGHASPKSTFLKRTKIHSHYYVNLTLALGFFPMQQPLDCYSDWSNLCVSWVSFSDHFRQ